MTISIDLLNKTIYARNILLQYGLNKDGFNRDGWDMVRQGQGYCAVFVPLFLRSMLLPDTANLLQACKAVQDARVCL